MTVFIMLVVYHPHCYLTYSQPRFCAPNKMLTGFIKINKYYLSCLYVGEKVKETYLSPFHTHKTACCLHKLPF